MNKGTTTKVTQVLRDDPRTRNSDALLIMEVYKRFYHMTNPVSHEKLLEIMAYESPDGICRVRRNLQNVKKLYRADEIIEHERFNRVDDARRVLGYPVIPDTL